MGNNNTTSGESGDVHQQQMQKTEPDFDEPQIMSPKLISSSS